MADPETLETLVRELRRLINRLAATADALHAPLAVTAPMRAVMEALDIDGPLTVPDIARARGVSRQHIQTIVNELHDAGLAAAHPNPAHRRSKLIALTDTGARRLALIREREAPLWRRYAARFTDAELDAALSAVRAISADLDAQKLSTEEENSDDS